MVVGPLLASSGNTFSVGHSREIYLGFRPLTAGKICTVAFFSIFASSIVRQQNKKRVYMQYIIIYIAT